MDLNKISFIKSAAHPEQFIYDGRPSVVFAGKSNVGKSSVINKLVNRKNLARVGSEPGKTIHVNYFLADNSLYLVDLPGYGYAKTSKAERDRWGRLMEKFFSMPELITLGVMITDSRHKPTADDITMAEWFKSSGHPFVIVANKIDKVKKSQLEGNLELIRETLTLPDEVKIIPFSAHTGDGKPTLTSMIVNLQKN